ncbi:MAG: LPS-assembly protein LptD [Pedobacter sp.]|nr:LPS-assembly protein LptD [Pedobacter sp.]
MPRHPHALLWLALFAPSCLAATADTADATRPPMGWATRAEIEALPAADRPEIDATCPGAWVTPIPPKAVIGRPEDSNVEAQADDVHYDANGVSTLRGSVSIRQSGRRIDADQAELSQNQGQGRFSGNILIAEPGLVMTGDQADYEFDTQKARVERTEFVSSAINAHGRADQIERNEKGVIKIARGEISTCPPGKRTWSFEAKDIKLDQETGRGTVRSAILNINETPVLYVPYFNFPIDDRRQSGILIPRFGNTNDGGFDFALPIYWNIAPNYDATITPRVMTRRGTMFEGEFRYLLPALGEGKIEGGYLPSDSLYGGRDRKSLSWKQDGEVMPDLQLKTNVNYVSDNAYFIDLGTDLSITNTAFQERTGELFYTPGNFWSLTTRVQGYQTIDPAILDDEKPYARLPQLLLVGNNPVARGWQPAVTTELTYFERKVDDGSGPEVNGGRYRLDPSIAYVMEAPWGRLVPTLKARSLVYQLEGDGVAPGSESEQLVVPSFSLDGGLVFESEQGHYTQTLEPRAFYLYAPYEDQSTLPNFDTANTTFSYQQLFRDSRFSGGDRIDDANQLSLGLTSRLIDHESGEEVIRASAGQITYFRDRKVRLDPTAPIATDASSGLAAQLAAPIGRGWSGSADAQWTSRLEHATQFSVNLNYLPESRDRLANLGYNFRREDPTIGQEALRQVSGSILQPIGISWQVIALAQYDLRTKESQDLLFGMQYEACCWKLRLYERQFLADPDDISPGAQRQRRAFFIEVELKGLAGLSSGVKSLLNNNVFGYNQIMEHQSSRKELP